MAATVEDQLSQLEKDIRQLQIEYDSYFAGGRKRPPSDTEWRVKTTISKFSERAGRLKYAQSFRFNNLTARYAKFSEMWRKRLKKTEAGHSAYAYSKVARELEEKRLEEASRQHEARLHHQTTQVAFSDPRRESEKVQSLYRSMLEAKKAAGQEAGINFEQFHKFVQQKTQQLKKQLGCQQVQYSVSVEGGQVKLKAKGA
ncbi:MAG: MXAN_5187 C-terminal domain-containing protein [Candidatus Acidoferrales bacterium]